MISTSVSVSELGHILHTAQLPGLPQSAVRLLELSQDRDNGPAEFARAIEGDPGLTSQVLRFVNSSYFGFQREIASVKLGITLVGVRAIKNFALWSAIFGLMPHPRHGSFELKNLWLDSLRRGLFAREMGKLVGVADPEVCFAAGLLQDMAIPVLVKELEGVYTRLIDSRQQGHVRLSDLEQRQFGWTHAQAGREIALKWNLPDSLAELIEQHTNLDQLLAAPQEDQQATVVALSSLLPATTDDVWVDFPCFLAAYTRLRQGVGTELGDLLTRVDGQLASFYPALDLASPHKLLTDYYQESLALMPSQG